MANAQSVLMNLSNSSDLSDLSNALGTRWSDALCASGLEAFANDAEDRAADEERSQNALAESEFIGRRLLTLTLVNRRAVAQ